MKEEIRPVQGTDRMMQSRVEDLSTLIRYRLSKLTKDDLIFLLEQLQNQSGITIDASVRKKNKEEIIALIYESTRSQGQDQAPE